MIDNPLDLSGRRILVTGASSGIGRETAIVLSRLSGSVVLVARDRQRLEATLDHLGGDGHGTEPFDLTAVEEIPGWMRTLSEKWGPFHGLVHCAGIRTTTPLRALTLKALDETIRINLTAAVMLAKGFRQKGLCVAGSGIVFLSSALGLVGEAGVAAYSASKAALHGVTKSLAVELAPENIRVNCIAAGLVQTEMAVRLRNTLSPEQFRSIEAAHPLGLGTAADVAHGIAYLLADTAKWITGSILIIDGGYTAR